MDTYEYEQNGTEQAELAPIPQRITRLSPLDTLFAASGTALVKVTKKGKEEILELPIQSVDLEEVVAMVGPEPRMPRRSDKGTDGKVIYVDDPQDANYRAAIFRHNLKFNRLIVCMGLAIDIEDGQGKVVWSADNATRNYEQADAVLRKMGIVHLQVNAINNAITALTQDTEARAVSD